MTPHEDFLWRVAGEVGRVEREFQRAIGATWTEAYQADWRVWHEVHDIARQPDRPLVTMGLRTITTPPCDHSVSRSEGWKNCMACGAPLT